MIPFPLIFLFILPCAFCNRNPQTLCRVAGHRVGVSIPLVVGRLDTGTNEPTLAKYINILHAKHGFGDIWEFLKPYFEPPRFWLG